MFTLDNIFKKKRFNISTFAEDFNFIDFIKEYNNNRNYLNAINKEFNISLRLTVEELEEQIKYNKDTGKNHFILLICIKDVLVYKNGKFDQLIDRKLIEVNSGSYYNDGEKITRDTEISLKYLNGLNDGDMVVIYNNYE